MSRSRSAVLILVGVLAIALVSRNDASVHWLQGLLGPRTALSLPAQMAQHAPVGGAPAGAPQAAPAQPPTPPLGGAAARAAATVSVAASARVEQGYVLEARLLTKDAKPMNEVAVRFYDVVELLGTREMLIGAATTDGQGQASVKYLPAELGRHEIVARAAPSLQATPMEARTIFEAGTAAAPAYAPEQLPLASFSDAAPYAAGAVVLAVWALFAVALLGTARRIAAGARPAASPLGPAHGAAARLRPATPRSTAAQRNTREDLG